MSGGSAVQVYGRYAYIESTGVRSIQVWDVLNPASPVLVNTIGSGVACGTAFGNIYGRYLYASIDTCGSETIFIYDLSNPASPVNVGNTGGGMLSQVQSQSVVGNYLYTTDTTGLLKIFNISNPASPSLVSTSTTYYGRIVGGNGHYLYGYNNLGETFNVYDLTTPTVPVLIGGIAAPAPNTTTGNPRLIFNGRYLYVGLNGSGVGAVTQAFDLGGEYAQNAEFGSAEVSALNVTGSETVSGGIQVGGGVNVIGSGSFGGSVGIGTGLTVQAPGSTSLFNADTVSQRVTIGGSFSAMTTPGAPTLGTSVGGSLAATTTYYYKIAAIDAAGGVTAAGTEANIATTGTNMTVTLSWTAVTGASGYRIYRGTTAGGENTFFTSNTASYTDAGLGGSAATPLTTGTALNSGTSSTSTQQLSVGTLSKANGQLFVSGTAPAIVASVPTYSVSAGVGAMAGSYVYLPGATGNAMRIYNVSNPLNPLLAGSVALSSGAARPVIQGKYLYVTDSSGLRIVDISNAASPSIVSTTSGISGYIQVKGNYLYTLSGSCNLQTVDITNPAAPTIKQTVAFPTCVGDFAIVGKYMYVIDGSGDLYTYNLSNPASPSYVGNTSTGVALYSLIAQGNYLYAKNGNSGVAMYVIDVTTPGAPFVAGGIASSNNSNNPRQESMAAQGNLLFDGRNGGGTIEIFDTTNPSKPTYTNSGVSFNGNLLGVQGHYLFANNNATGALEVYDVGGAYVSGLQAGTVRTSSLQVDGTSVFSGDTSVQGNFGVGGASILGGDVSVSGSTLLQGAVSLTTGIQGGAAISNISTPGSPTITNGGTAGAVSYSYAVSAVSYAGVETPVSTAGSTASGNATLTGTNYNTIAFTPVAGAVSYKVYRTASAGTPATTGLIGTITNSTMNDTGIAGTTAAPAVYTGNVMRVGTLTTADSNAQVIISTGTTGNKGLVVQGTGAQTADYFQIQRSDGYSFLRVYSGGGVGSLSIDGTLLGNSVVAGGAVSNISLGQLTTYTANATSIGSVVRGFASQTADLQQYQNTSGAVLSRVDANGNLIVNLGIPPTPSISTSTTGGTLAANTYYYKITALDAAGNETIASTEVSVTTTGATSSNIIGASPNFQVFDATSYRVYRGTSAGAENVYYATASATYTDTNAASTGGSPPTTNTARGAYITSVGASFLGANANTGLGNFAVGVGASATGQNGIALGANASTTSNQSAAIFGTASNVGAIALGGTASGRSSFATQGANAVGQNSVALGSRATSTAYGAITLQGGKNGSNSVNNVTNLSFQYGTDINGGTTVYARGGGSYTGTGTVATTNGSPTVTGVGTTFTNDFIIGDRIAVGAETYTVIAIGSDTSLTAASNFTTTNSAGTAFTVLPAIFKLQDSTGAAKLFLNDRGYLGVGQTSSIYNNGNQLDVESGGNNNIARFASSTGGLSVVSSGTAVQLQTDGTGALLLQTSAGGNVGIGGATTPGARLQVNTGAVGNVGQIIQGFLGQTADLLQIQTASGMVSKFDANGNLAVGTSAAQTAQLVVVGGSVFNGLSAPAQPTVTNAGTAGATNYSYCVTAITATGETACSTARQTTTGNATLDATNYNTITWTAVQGATGYNVYRSASSGSPSTLGILNSTPLSAATLTLNDQGSIAAITPRGTYVPTTTGGSSGRVQATNGVSYDASGSVSTRAISRTLPSSVGDYVEIFRLRSRGEDYQFRVSMVGAGVSKEYVFGSTYGGGSGGNVILTPVSNTYSTGASGYSSSDFALEQYNYGASDQFAAAYRLRLVSGTGGQAVTIRVETTSRSSGGVTSDIIETSNTGTSTISATTFSSLQFASNGGSLTVGGYGAGNQSSVNGVLYVASNASQNVALLVANKSQTSFLQADGNATKTTASGSLLNQGNLVISNIAAPTSVSVSNAGTTGGTSYSYVVTSRTADGVESVVSSTVTTATGNATLDATNYNTISWARKSGAASYRIYRTASGGTPATTGLIGTVSDNAATLGSFSSIVAPSLNDTGLSASGTVPTAPSGNLLKVGTVATADTLATQIIGADDVTHKGLVIQGASGQSADLFQIQNNSGTALAKFDNNGYLTSSNIQLFNNAVGRQEIGTINSDALGLNTFSTGNVTIGSGNTSTALLVSNSTILNNNANQPSSAAGNGVSVGNTLLVKGSKGGNTTGTTGQIGGTGSTITINAGAGGDAGSGATNGNGGSITVQGGAAGTGAGAAGTAGAINLQLNGGNVNIGTVNSSTNTTTIAGILTVGSSGSGVSQFNITAANSTNTNATINLSNPSSSNYRISTGGSTTSDAGNFRITNTTDGVGNITLQNATGNVGIGTSAPTARLHVNGTLSSQTGAGTVSSSGLTVTGTGTSFGTDLHAGDTITASGQTKTVASVASATSLTTTSAFSPALSSAAFTYQQPNARIQVASSQTADALQVVSSSGNTLLAAITANGTLDLSNSGNINSSSPTGNVNLLSFGSVVASFRNTGTTFQMGGVAVTTPSANNGVPTSSFAYSGQYSGTNTSSLIGLNVQPTVSSFTNSGIVKGINVDLTAVSNGTVYAATFLGGNVGVGTATPVATLDIRGTTNNTGAYLTKQYASGSVLRNSVTDSGVMDLFLNGGVGEVGSIELGTPNNTPGFAFFSTTNTGRSQIRQTGATGGLSFGATTGAGQPTDVLNITTSDRVGIGNGSPGALLGVGSSSQLTVDTSGSLSTSGLVLVTANNTNAFRIQNGSSQNVFDIDSTNKIVNIGGGVASTLNATGAVTFQNPANATTLTLQASSAQNTGGANLIEFKNSSNVTKSSIDAYGNANFVTGDFGAVYSFSNIALTSKSYADNVKGLVVTGYSGSQSADLLEVTSSANDSFLNVDASGHVGINNATPGYMLHVGSSSTTTGTTVARFENAGGTCDVTPNTTGGITCTSDSRLKKNITPYGGSALDKILGIGTVTYNLNSEADGTQAHTGVVAQDFQQLFPDLVNTDSNGYLSVSYAGLTPYLAKAIQEQQQTIDTLNGNVSAAQTSIQNLLNGNSDISVHSLTVAGPAQFATLTVVGDLNVGGNLAIGGGLAVVGQTTVADLSLGGHLRTLGVTPTSAVVEASAGTGAVITIDGNDTSGTITLATGHKTTTDDGHGHITVTGNDPAAGILANITFNKAFGKTPRIILTPHDGVSAPVLIYPVGQSATGFSFSFANLPAASGTYSFDYFIVE